ncbi:TPA: hypothetical protein ACGDVI_000004 [Acinetobacter baumannii]|uniref:hypothetical protein n=1 Tax=Acinetobacter baumannii TaxID=470 RepID=UPI000F73E3A7|nr:hypothetical protein [Acinetobacter baumannii]MDO7200756.1 hypothetical protein [Acinetobacter baumannii]RSP97611.1 hypothetical protein EA716_02150 [Acinetobacter baumannii]HEE5793702.1 hypothetical protein [Acinetobacter baumannii]
MKGFFLSTRVSKYLGNSDEAISEQIEKFEKIITDISDIDPIFKTWFINNPVGSKPPYDYPFPSEKARKYFFDLKKNDKNVNFNLWNGSLESEPYAGFYLSSFGSVLTFKKVLSAEQVVQIFKVLLKYFKFEYINLNSFFFSSINIYHHRLPTTSICYVPVEIAADYLPHLYKKVDIDNQLNKGTILVFDENWADETDNLKKIVQENSIALIELGAIPETETPENFYDE